MVEFTPHGPYRVKTDCFTHGRIIAPDEFWAYLPKSPGKYRRRKGIYVFAIKTPRTQSYTPYYVGKATRSFEQEVFTDRNQLKYNRALARFTRGYPCVFLIVHPETRGKTNTKCISSIEDYLIQLGYSVNPDVENARGIKRPKWAIAGVIKGKTRKPSLAARNLSDAFGLRKRE